MTQPTSLHPAALHAVAAAAGRREPPFRRTGCVAIEVSKQSHAGERKNKRAHSSEKSFAARAVT